MGVASPTNVSEASSVPMSTEVDSEANIAPPDAMKWVSSMEVSAGPEMKSSTSFSPQDNFSFEA